MFLLTVSLVELLNMMIRGINNACLGFKTSGQHVKCSYLWMLEGRCEFAESIQGV